MATPQEVFDTVVAHLRAQKMPAFSDENGCSYRDDQGRKCAVGCVIPDPIYDKWMEGHSITDIAHSLAPCETKDLLLQHHGLLRSLQRAHDMAGGRDDAQQIQRYWEDEFLGIALQFGLKYSPP